ncbi:MAG: beta strand repeat-containing protein, partial [Candidatus Hodarchaeota archaeon]
LPVAGVYDDAPAYDITITEDNLDQYCYTLNGGSPIYITSTTGTIDSTEWSNLPDGFVEIMFYANDTAGNEGSNSITVTKDTTNPVITITLPVAGVYDGAPAYDITITEENLDQYWYTLNGGFPIFIILTTGAIHSTEWSNLPDGSVEIIFYANDTAGNEGSNSVTVTKDTTDPVITITLPEAGVYSDAPAYDITITEDNLDQYWYTLNGGSYIFITSTTDTIDSTEWGNLPDGLVEIMFYANDTAGNEGSNSVTVTKDTTDPVITITLPAAGVYRDAPAYDITITGDNLDQYWYTLNGGSPIFITSTTGTIDSTEWGNLPDGSVEIIFYANDTAGNEGSNSVTVTKDTTDPVITITLPVAGVYDGAPAYDITITEENLDQYWYTLNGGSPVYITSTTDTIDSTGWSNLPDGSVEIMFYANDTAGNEGSNSVTVIKDTTDPVITITLPVAGVYGDAPAYDITITEENLDQYWYTLNGGSYIFITSTTGTLDSTEWGNLPDGSVEIIFYANDTAGNEGSNSVTVTKDTTDPVITITLPVAGVYDEAPAYDITVTEDNLDQYWYTLNGGAYIYITSATGTIDSTEWGNLPDGSVEIMFYVNDTAGNEGSNSVTVTKDTTDPVITVTLPVADVYGDAPAYDITITEDNLDQYWYTLNGGSYIFIISTTGTIDSTEWGNLPDGSVEIMFYANDTAGNEGSNSVTVTKDTTDPVITITLPVAGVYDGAPAYDITITGDNLDQYWYTLNGGSPIYITSTTGTIDSTEWGNLPDGSVEIMFYANDTAGNEGSNSVIVTKDTTDPVITITLPVAGVYDGAPAYDITVTEDNLDQYWYTLNGGSPIFITSTTGPIDSTEWSNLPDGSVEIIFYANDTAGNEGSNSVTVSKDTTDPIITITAPLAGVYYGAPTYDITIAEDNLDQYWYTLNGGVYIFITSTTGIIDSTEWSNLPDGSIEIIFYANDTAGNEGSNSVTVTKDTTDPVITITLPVAGVYSDAPAYVITITEDNLDQYWYTINGGAPIFITSITGTIDSTEWGNLPDGSIEIIFYANDTAGNEGSNSVTVTKDTTDPVITIILPVVGVYDGAPTYDITIAEDNLDQYWYTLNGGSPIFITSTTGIIDSTGWSNLPDGSVEIIFYANDTAGNEGSNSVTVTKDTTNPVITITLPVVGVYNGAPAYDITIAEDNLDQYWYTLNGGAYIYITSATGTIDSTEWGNLPDGPVEIIFYANDTAGNEGSNSVTVTKDTTDPIITISTPLAGVYDGAPVYDITITEDNLDQYWYTINGGAPIFITSAIGTIDSTEWGNLPDGSVEIIFYANDTAGNEGSNSVTVTKDTTDPVITITLPVAGVYSDAPAYDITITEDNLDQYWYTLNGGSYIFITSTTGTIDSTEWGNLPNGLVEIMFYANDAAGNEGSNSVTVTKDTTDPIITITAPLAGVYNGAPAYDITVTGDNLDQYWYTLNGGAPISIISTTGTIDSTEWGNLPDGSVEIIFYANDTAGNEGSNSVTVTKDTTDPIITITAPLAGVYSGAPTYGITITDDNSDQYWYTLNGGTPIYITSTTGTIDSTEWSNLPDGFVEIMFYANDTAGNEGFNSVTVTKDTTDPVITIILPVAGVYSDAPAYDITITEDNLDQYWYTLNGGSPIYITSTIGAIDSSEWGNLPDGSVEIMFYANDTASNEGSNSVTVTKDTTDPVITITLPVAGIYDGAPVYDITITEANLDQYWYTLNGGSYIFIISTTGTIDSTEWGNLPNGLVEIMFYANDTAGNEGSNSVTVTKDTTDPVITITHPVAGVYGDAPAYDITITEENLDQYWYTLNGGAPIYITSTTDTIDLTEWNNLPDGFVEIMFSANDTAGNEGSNSVTVTKDTTDPVITIILPVAGVYEGAPVYDITITENNLDQYWYTLNGGSPIYITSTTDTIDSTEWGNLLDDLVEIMFYANDTAGNEGSNSVTVTKDTTDPFITITLPVAGVYGDAPAYDITITEENLDQYWYTLNGGSPIYITSTTGTIDSTEWSNLPDGSVEIMFYANDTAGNEGSNSVSVTKDTTDPVITITLPVAGVYDGTPAYDITITDDNSDQYWYTLNGGSYIFITSTTGTIDSTEWGNLLDGPVEIMF